MEGIVQLCLGVFCVLTPVLLFLLVGGIYGLGIGGIKLPGVARTEIRPGKEWTTVPDLTKKISQNLAAVLSLIGALFGLIGFLLPWVRVDIGAASDFLDIGGLNGTLSGIALAFQSMLAGLGLFSADIEGAAAIAFLLILVSLVVWLIPLALLVTAALGVGLISIPLGLVKMQTPKLSRPLLIMSILSLCLACGFFAGIQATVGGVKVGGSESVFGSSFSMGVQVANGFWITVGGLVLALVGAVISNTIAEALSKWAENLASLEREQPPEPTDDNK
ncbi:MAG: hypothetical protein HND47_20445 [Chloroflexi bacterium]|nr:hypothetical protein [Chloroflexota bacterium]